MPRKIDRELFPQYVQQRIDVFSVPCLVTHSGRMTPEKLLLHVHWYTLLLPVVAVVDPDGQLYILVDPSQNDPCGHGVHDM